MSIGLITILMITAIGVLVAFGLPLAFVTGTIAVVAGMLSYGPAILPMIASRVYSFIGEYVLVAVPMFILMACLMEHSGIARDLYKALHVWAGNVRGGVAVMTLLAATMMAAMTGIIGGEIVLLGMIALPQMLRLGYNKKLAIGTICAGGSLGTMIPPSIVLIIYGLTANVSISDLFVAVVIPGLILASIYATYILIRCYMNPKMGPLAPLEERQVPFLTKLAMMRSLILPIVVAVSVLGSIYAGIASVTEAAGMGVVGMGVSVFVRGEMTWPMVRDSLRQTLSTCGMIIWLSIGAFALIGVYNLLGGIEYVKEFVGTLPFPPLVVIFIMMGILIVMGCFMDWIGILFLTMPVFVPAIVTLGYDPIWFGVLFCMNMQVSYLSPPFGPAAFYLKGVAPPDISLDDIFRAVVPFIGLQLIGLTIVISFPELTLWLPSLLYH